MESEEKDIKNNNENIKNVKENKVTKKKCIGRLTFGLTLILLGISIFIQSVVSFEILRYVLMMWPLIFIALGVEIIYYTKKNDVNLKYDVSGIILIFVILVCTSIFSVINYGVNKVLYNEDISKFISEEMANLSHSYTLNTKVNIVNIADKKVDLKIVEDGSYKGTKLIVNGKTNDKLVKDENIISLITGNYSISSIIDIDQFLETVKEDTKSKKIEDIENEDEIQENDVSAKKYYSFVTIEKFPKWLDSIEITVITNNKENITTKGEFNII